MEIIKWIFYVLILWTSSSIGIIYSKKYQNRVNELKDFKTALNMLKTKIRFTNDPLKECFADISKSVTSKTANIFSNTCTYMEKYDVTTSWNKAINDTETNLTKEDKKIINMFGRLLGKTDLDGQLNEIELSLNFIETQIETAEVENSKSTKLYKSLGIITGIGIIIVLI